MYIIKDLADLDFEEFIQYSRRLLNTGLQSNKEENEIYITVKSNG